MKLFTAEAVLPDSFFAFSTVASTTRLAACFAFSGSGSGDLATLVSWLILEAVEGVEVEVIEGERTTGGMLLVLLVTSLRLSGGIRNFRAIAAEAGPLNQTRIELRFRTVDVPEISPKCP